MTGCVVTSATLFPRKNTRRPSLRLATYCSALLNPISAPLGCCGHTWAPRTHGMILGLTEYSGLGCLVQMLGAEVLSAGPMSSARLRTLISHGTPRLAVL